MQKITQATCFLIVSLISFSLSAGVQRTVCNGSVGTGQLDPDGDIIWNGAWTYLNGSGWHEGRNYVRSLSDGPVGQQGDTPPTGDYLVCWSLSPFTKANTNDGETCVHDGPLDYTYSTTYYRMNIDRSVSPTEYCQVAMVTGPENATRGNTYVVELADDLPSPVPTLQWWALLTLAGAVGTFGVSRLRRVT